MLISELIQSKSALKTQCFRAKKSALNSAEFFRSEQRWFRERADPFHVLWITAEKRQISETALFSADYLWNFNPGSLTVNASRNKQVVATLK